MPTPPTRIGSVRRPDATAALKLRVAIRKAHPALAPVTLLKIQDAATTGDRTHYPDEDLIHVTRQEIRQVYAALLNSAALLNDTFGAIS